MEKSTGESYDVSVHLIWGLKLKDEPDIENIVSKLVTDVNFENFWKDVEIPGSNEQVGTGYLIPETNYKIVSIYNYTEHDGTYIVLKMYDHHVYKFEDS